MTSKWPTFNTADLGDTPEDAAEMMRRWEEYNGFMQAIISAGGVHQDDDGWWIDDATGHLIGPDPEIERPRSAEDIAAAKPLREVLPDLYENIQKSRGRPRADDPKEAVTLRIARSTLERWKRRPDWRAEMVEAIEKAT